MGYDLHIIRKTNWEIDEESNISLDEWLNYMEGDAELEPDSFDKTNPELTQGFCYWNNPAAEEEEDRPWLDYGHGLISTKNPEKATIIKMVSIANTLNAKVTGDEGEFYDELGDAIINAKVNNQNPQSRKPWWKLWS